MKLSMFIVIFLLLGAFFLISENNINLGSSGGFDKLTGLYSTWFGQIFDNGKQVTGYVLRMDWLPGNKTA